MTEFEIRTFNVQTDYDTLNSWLVDGYKWKSGIPEEFLGEGLVASCQGEPIAMGFMAFVNGTKIALLMHMIGNPEKLSKLKQEGLERIIDTLCDYIYSRLGEDAGIIGIYEDTSVLRILEKMGFTISQGEHFKVFKMFKEHDTDFIEGE